jgi:hypothetical protein
MNVFTKPSLRSALWNGRAADSNAEMGHGSKCMSETGAPVDTMVFSVHPGQ